MVSPGAILASFPEIAARSAALLAAAYRRLSLATFLRRVQRLRSSLPRSVGILHSESKPYLRYIRIQITTPPPTLSDRAATYLLTLLPFAATLRFAQ